MKGMQNFSARLPFLLSAISIANITSNLLFQWFIFTYLGSGILADTFFASLGIPQLFTTIFSASITQVLVTILAGEPLKDQLRDAWTFLICTTTLFAVIAIFLIVSACWWVPLIIPGFSPEAKLIAFNLIQISLVGTLFAGISAVQMALGIAQHKYLYADSVQLVANLTAVLLLVWFMPIYGIWGAAWISVLRQLLQALLLQPLMGKPMTADLQSTNINIAWQRLKPILFGTSYYKMDPLVDRYLLSAASTGSISLLYISQQLHSASCQVVSKAFAIPIITKLVITYKQQNLSLFSKILTRALWVILGICLVGVAVFWLFGQQLTLWVMAQGKFTSNDANELWILLLLSAGMFIAGTMSTLTSGAFYAISDTRTPTWLGSLAFTIGILLKILMFNYYGLHGLALAISFYYLLSLSLQLFVLQQRGAI